MNASFATTWALIVDDDPDDWCLLSHAFKQVCPRLHCVFVSSGVEAVTRLKKTSIPLFMLTDLNMPQQNGIELTRQLKHHPRYCTIPIIICTTSESAADRRRCYQAGANAFISKPHQFDKLTELIRCIVALWMHAC